MSPLPPRTTWRSVALLLVTWLAPLGSASVIHVRAGATGANNGTSWVDAYPDLQIALWFSQPGDEIRVAQGIYKPTVPGGSQSVSFVLRSGQTLRGGFAGVGADPDARDPALYVTTLSGDINSTNMGNSYHVLIATDVDDSTVLDGFTITGGRADTAAPDESGGGLRLVNASVQIRACRIVENVAGYAPSQSQVVGRGGGIYIEGGAPHLADCLIQQNTSWLLGGGAYLRSSYAEFENCQFIANRARNPVRGVGDGGGVYCVQGGPAFRNCDIELNECRESGGGLMFRQSTPALMQCRISENQTIGGYGGGLSIDDFSHAVLTACQVLANELEGGGGGGIAVTSESSVAISSSEISFNVTDRGGSPGGGVYCFDSVATLSNSTISGNRASPGGGASVYVGGGGGIWCEGSGAALSMHNCVIEGNTAPNSLYLPDKAPPPGGNGGGVAMQSGAQAVIVNSTFDRNQGGSGGSGWIGSAGGSGGAVSVESGASAQLHGCVFHDNVAGPGGVGSIIGPYPGGNGGALFVSSDATCQVSCSTLAENEAGYGAEDAPRGTGGASNGAGIQYSNCLIWANTPNQLAGEPSVRYSDVQGGAAGVGNISSDPIFVNAGQDNFRLAQFSPCIDAGENASVPADSLDLDSDGDVTESTPLDRDGNPRFEDDSGLADTGAGTPPIVDLGAYEFGQTSGCPADLDGDGVVSLADLARLLSNFGRSGDASPADGDMNGDGSVNLTDLTIFLSDFGATC
jgi:hypothetical protein